MEVNQEENESNGLEWGEEERGYKAAPFTHIVLEIGKHELTGEFPVLSFAYDQEKKSIYPKLSSGRILTRSEYRLLSHHLKDYYDQISDEEINAHNQSIGRREVLQQMLSDISVPLDVGECNKPGWIYVLKSEHGCKIGMTKRIDERTRLFDIILPFDVEVVVTMKVQNMAYTERKLHDFYWEKRIKGEWFNLTDNDIERLKAMVTLGIFFNT